MYLFSSRLGMGVCSLLWFMVLPVYKVEGIKKNIGVVELFYFSSGRNVFVQVLPDSIIFYIFFFFFGYRKKQVRLGNVGALARLGSDERKTNGPPAEEPLPLAS